MLYAIRALKEIGAELNGRIDDAGSQRRNWRRGRVGVAGA